MPQRLHYLMVAIAAAKKTLCRNLIKTRTHCGFVACEKNAINVFVLHSSRNRVFMYFPFPFPSWGQCCRGYYFLFVLPSLSLAESRCVKDPLLNKVSFLRTMPSRTTKFPTGSRKVAPLYSPWTIESGIALNAYPPYHAHAPLRGDCPPLPCPLPTRVSALIQQPPPLARVIPITVPP